MPRNKVILSLIENESDRKVSYKKREKGFLKKAHELSTLCDVEIAVVIDSPYNNEPTIFPNYSAAINTFIKFKELPTLEKSKDMVTREEFTKKRIEKIEKKLLKVRKQNRLKEITNDMYEVTKGKDVSPNMDPYYFNDLSYVIKKNIMQIRKAMNADLSPMGSSMPINNHQNYTTNSPQSPQLSELLNWNNDDVVTLLEDPSLHNINSQDPNHTNNT
ncbi:agamous-like MADS-box protein AGL80 [Solanum pennellii]|uniref:Agamous-like MADS-box protein AGL80 n=1 Tax=Solanum pennellii TaxID=28526 RepID=A0ABM1V9F0_SOLPN|nr:agamous-like MADS-box protein AGL80 [Solanum pennellii]